MNLSKNSKFGALAFVLTCAAAPSYADWAQSIYPNYMPPMPTNRQVQSQNPPAFTWSKYPGDASKYLVDIQAETAPGSNIYKSISATYFETTRNFYLPSAPLAKGNYQWRVTPAGVQASGKASPTDWSTLRGFAVDATAVTFVVPENTALIASISARPRPRQLPNGFLQEKNWGTAIRADRGAALTALKAEVTDRIKTLPLITDSQWPLVATATVTPAKVAQDNNVRDQIGLATRQLEAAALLYTLTGDTAYLNEALVRGDQLCLLNVSGATSYLNQDQATRQITVALMKAFDYLRADIDRLDIAQGKTRRKTWLGTVKARMVDIYADLARENFRMDQAPFDSHGSTLLAYVSVAAVLALGEPELKDDAATWFNGAYRAYVNWVSVWAGPEGGFADGTAFGQYTVDFYLQLWQPLTNATGVNLFNKPWAVGFSKYLMHFQPPGAPGHVFGDSHDDLVQPTLMKAFASRFATPNAAWYVKRLSGSAENPLTLLSAEYPLPVSKVLAEAPPANGAAYASIGWAAMHSDMSNVNRTSVYFKSSPYGAYNHSHSDQNSIVIDSGGKRLLTESGYYDYFNSPLGVSWYRTTKAKNAVTFDTGAGQLTGAESWQNLLKSGKLNTFSTTAKRDYVEGDATAAYAPTLSSAIRKVWYLRDIDVVVVVDKLKAPAAHTYEWNMHSQYTTVSEALTTPPAIRSSVLQDTAALQVKINNGGTTLCINSLSPDVNLVNRDAISPKAKAGLTEHHATFVKKAAKANDEFVIVMSVGCKDVRPTIVTSGNDRLLKLMDSKGVKLSDDVSIGAP